MRAKHAHLVSGVLKLRQKPLNFMSGAVHRRTILYCVAARTDAKLRKKIVHRSLTLNAYGPGVSFPISGHMTNRISLPGLSTAY